MSDEHSEPPGALPGELNAFDIANQPPAGTRVLLVYRYHRGREPVRHYIDCQIIVSAGFGEWTGSDGKHLRGHRGQWLGWVHLPFDERRASSRAGGSSGYGAEYARAGRR